jgi:hypothetical protein
MALFDNSGNLLANVALTDTFDEWRGRTNQILEQAAGLSSNNVFDGALNTFESIEANTMCSWCSNHCSCTFNERSIIR